MKTILVPTDFSKEAKYALDFGIKYVKKTSGKILLLHIVDPPTPPAFETMGPPPAEMMDNVYIVELVKKSEEQLEKLAKKGKEEGIKIETEVQLGNPFAHIAKKITDIEVDLIIMGTKGASGLEEVLIGSNTERVIRAASCPVFAIGEKTDPDLIGHIAYPTNFGADDDRVIEEVKKLQKVLEAKLHIVKINTPHSYLSDAIFREKIQDFAKKHQLSNYEVHMYNAINEEEGIEYFADELGIDLIAMPTHGRKGLLHFLLGSVAEDVANHIPKPVWTFNIKKIEH